MNEWARSIKRPDGDVWHLVRFSTSAHCDRRVRLQKTDRRSAPPADAYCCKRCTAIAGRQK